MEIIPAIDIRGGKCVRLEQGDYDRETVFADDPVQMADHWASGGATRLHIVDLDGARSGVSGNESLISEISRRSPVPIQVGGGIRSEAVASKYLGDLGVGKGERRNDREVPPVWLPVDRLARAVGPPGYALYASGEIDRCAVVGDAIVVGTAYAGTQDPVARFRVARKLALQRHRLGALEQLSGPRHAPPARPLGSRSLRWP